MTGLFIIGDGLIVLVVLWNLTKAIIGDRPIGRLMAIIIGIGGGVLYTSLACNADDCMYGDAISRTILLAPYIIIIIFVVFSYVLKGTKKNNQ